MSPKIFKLNRLRVFAVEATNRAIITEFNFIFKKKEESSKDDVNVDYLLNREERDEALKELRKKLDHYLIGPFSTERQQFLDRFINSYNNLSPSGFF